MHFLSNTPPFLQIREHTAAVGQAKRLVGPRRRVQSGNSSRTHHSFDYSCRNRKVAIAIASGVLIFEEIDINITHYAVPRRPAGKKKKSLDLMNPERKDKTRMKI